MNDTKLFTKRVSGDFIALEAKYLKHCALMCHNHIRSKLRRNNPTVSQNIQKYKH